MDAVYHLREALRSNIADAEGDVCLAKRLNAETKLRLMRMSDEELWELARLTSYPPERSIEATYIRYKQRIEELETTSGNWMRDMGYISITDGRG